MKAKEVSIQDLYEGGVIYVTPSFQRSYTYQENSVKPLIESAVMENGMPHFLGPIVTRVLDQEGSFEKALLIDGNQRLITLLMLLIALRDVMEKDHPQEALGLHTLCFAAPKGAPGTFKNIVSRHDRAVFEAAASATPLPETSHPLAKVYLQSRKAFAEIPAKRHPQILERLLCDFTFVVFAMTTEDDPYPIFKLFNPGEEEAARVGRDSYREYARDPKLMDLIAAGESQKVEFKAHAITHNRHGNEEGTRGAGNIVRAVASMLNSSTGGTLLIGVEDNGQICGVENEYIIADKGKSNWDGYQLFLANILRSRLDAKNPFLHYTIERRQTSGHDICMITIEPSDEPTYVDKRLYVRTLNQTVEMLGPDLIAYVETRFKK